MRSSIDEQLSLHQVVSQVLPQMQHLEALHKYLMTAQIHHQHKLKHYSFGILSITFPSAFPFVRQKNVRNLDYLVSLKTAVSCDIKTVERLAKVLCVNPAYFFARDDQLAALLENWDRLTKNKKEKVLALMAELML